MPPRKRTERPEKPTPAEAADLEANPPGEDDADDGMVTMKFRDVELRVPSQEKLMHSFRARIAMRSGTDADLFIAVVGDRVATDMWRLIDESKDTYESVMQEFFTAYFPLPSPFERVAAATSH